MRQFASTDRSRELLETHHRAIQAEWPQLGVTCPWRAATQQVLFEFEPQYRHRQILHLQPETDFFALVQGLRDLQ